MITLKIFKQNIVTPTVQKIETFPCRIGRSIKNRVVLDDPSISIDHAIINFDSEGYYIQDLGSTNGIIFEGERKDIVRINQNCTFYVGSLRVEIIFGEEILDKTRIIHLPASIIFHNQKKMIILSVLYFSILTLLSYLHEYLLNPIDKKNFLNIIWIIVSGFIVLLITSGAFSIFSKIHVKKYRLFTFFSFFALWSCIFILIFDFLPYIAFYINHKTSYTIIETVANYCFLLYSTYLLATMSFIHTSRKKIAIVAGSLFCIIQGLLFITDTLREDDNFSYQGSLSYPISSYKRVNYRPHGLYNIIDKSVTKVDKLRIDEIKKREKEKKKNNKM